MNMGLHRDQFGQSVWVTVVPSRLLFCSFLQWRMFAYFGDHRDNPWCNLSEKFCIICCAYDVTTDTHVIIAFSKQQLLGTSSSIFSSWLSAHESLWTEISYYTVHKFIATLDIPPLIVANNKQGLYVVVCIQIHVGKVSKVIAKFSVSSFCCTSSCV